MSLEFVTFRVTKSAEKMSSMLVIVIVIINFDLSPLSLCSLKKKYTFVYIDMERTSTSKDLLDFT